MRQMIIMLLVFASLWPPAPAAAQDAFFTTTDGVRLHYVDTSPTATAGPALVFVPGWTMPGWIFTPQMAAFAPSWRVVVLDPRGQGDSEAPLSGYNQDRRGQDIAELIAHLQAPRVVLLGWSLGVLDALAYVHGHGDALLAGLVLIDNSVGESPPPPAPRPGRPGPPIGHAAYMAAFVRGMFRRPQPPDYLARLTNAALRTPEFAARALLAYPVPRSYWKEALYSTQKPVLYIVRPSLAGQAGNVAAHHPSAEAHVVADLGHAMFVDDPQRFDGIVGDFLARRVAR